MRVYGGGPGPRPFRGTYGPVVILASGPSLTDEQCEYVRERQQAGACRVIAINSTCFRAPWADTCYAFDWEWWHRYHAEAPDHKEKVTGSPQAAELYGLTLAHVVPGSGLSTKPGTVYSGLNSGHQAIQWAYQSGASAIYLLGYDMQHTGGRRHWHGDHPPGLTNAEGIQGWVPKFAPLAKALALVGVPVVNCSTETALTCFERGRINDHL